MTSFNAAVAFDAAIGFDNPTVNVETFPQITLWWSPTTGPFTTPSWEAFPTITVDGTVRQRIRHSAGITITRGRNDELGPFEAGVMELTVDNRDRALDPLNTASAYLTALRPNIPIQLRATWSGTTYTLFTGFVDGWPQVQHLSQNDLVCELSCTDMTTLLARRTLRPGRPFVLDLSDGQAARLDASNKLADRKPDLPVEYSGSRVTNLLTTAGLPTALLDVDGGDTQLIADIPEDDQLGDYLDRICRTENAKLFIAADGMVTFQGRHTVANATSSATFVDTSATGYRYEDLVIDPESIDLVRNEVRRGRDQDTTVTARSVASINLYGLIADEQNDLLHADTAELADATDWMIARYAQPRTRVREFTVVPQRAASTLFPSVLGWELGTRITVTAQPMDTGVTFSQVVDVESVQHAIGQQSWSTTYGCALADTGQYFQLDTATYGRLDALNTLNY